MIPVEIQRKLNKEYYKILEWEATKIKNRTVEDDVILQNEDDEYSILPGRDYTYYWDFSFLKQL